MGSEPNVILYTAMSLDGYIAKEDGSGLARRYR